MTAGQPIRRRAAAAWRAVRRAAAALRAINDEQVLMWELFWQSSRVPTGRTGPLAWVASLDGPRLTGSNLPSHTSPAPGAGHDPHPSTGAADGR